MSNKRSRASSIASNDASTSSSGLGASTSRAASTAPQTGPLVHPSQDLDDFQESFWRYQMDLVEQGGDADGNMIDFKSGLPTQGQLPLARIKKVMKSDDQVKMISAEAPILFARACEIFISDLTCRAFLIAEEHKRRTIQRSDIAGAIGRSDLFDFLIDIVPRHESVPSSRLPGGGAAKREKTGEGQNANRAGAAAARQRAGASQQQQPYQSPEQITHDHEHASEEAAHQHQLHSETASSFMDHETNLAGSLTIPHTGAAPAHDSMANWIHDASSDSHAATQQADASSHPHPHPPLDYAQPGSGVPNAWTHAFPGFG
ncbi:histone-fold-containing protein [Testicularia cyperi]|uniref:Histone-fold-containing protein n=1 Tax=Testicularia cyperi TaxID=1882483 RepID=A0A317XMG7_9BASI|nr:histone-fold-containing protein [Testicularia cyperi]